MNLFKKNPYRPIEKRLGYTFRRKELLATALRHSSYRHECDADQSDNQRLEFLGDSALGLVASDYLFLLFPQIEEGGLTCLRSRMTSGKALARIGASIQLGDFIQLGKGEQASGGRERESTITDAMEAVLGAAYLDGSLKAVRKIFDTLFVPQIAVQPGDSWGDNPKGHLQALAQQRWHTNPVYRIIGREGPPHASVFTIEVAVAGKTLGRGRGPCKRDAQQSAAHEAIQSLNAPAAGRRSQARSRAPRTGTANERE